MWRVSSTCTPSLSVTRNASSPAARYCPMSALLSDGRSGAAVARPVQGAEGQAHGEHSTAEHIERLASVSGPQISNMPRGYLA
eukprot:1181100-Prymnesium_polylepis.2